MTVNYGPAGEKFKKGRDQATSAIALGGLDPDFFKPADFVIDCDGCTACCKGDDGPRINEDELDDYACHRDDKGEWRLDQTEEGHCVYLGEHGCTIHATQPRDLEAKLPAQPPRICRDFDCRSIILKFNNRGLDQLVNSRQLPLDVVIQGRAKLKQFNDMINVRAVTTGADLSALLMTPAEERTDAPDDPP